MELHEMTPEKRARIFTNLYPHNDAISRQLSEMVASIITTAVLEERESNARIAEKYGADNVAASIRART